MANCGNNKNELFEKITDKKKKPIPKNNTLSKSLRKIIINGVIERHIRQTEANAAACLRWSASMIHELLVLEVTEY